jgi:antitoxin component YwqK of YwqJK toxin-antitoxin module
MLKINTLFITLLFLLSIVSCSKKYKRIRLSDSYAEGQISNDTVFNGEIKFYDLNTNHLTEIATYNSGVLNGKRIVYHNNGKIKAVFTFLSGKANGEIIINDTNGNILQKQNFYHDLLVGPSIHYKNNEVKQYYFYSFDNEQLLTIDYDSIDNKPIDDINDGKFIFWHLNKYSTSESDSLQTELFIYLPNPPNIRFKYSLCITDKVFNVRKVIRDFDSENIWEKITLNFLLLHQGETFSIRLKTSTPFTNDRKNSTMFKSLKYGS